MVESYQALPFFNAGRGSLGEIPPRRKGRDQPDCAFSTLSQVSSSIHTESEPPSISALKGASSYLVAL